MERRVCNVFTGLALVLAITACSKEKQKVAGPDSKGGAKPEQPIQATIQPAQGSGDAPPAASPIYFDFDSYNIVETSKTELQQVAGYMQKHPGSTVTISGHTDERG